MRLNPGEVRTLDITPLPPAETAELGVRLAAGLEQRDAGLGLDVAWSNIAPVGGLRLDDVALNQVDCVENHYRTLLKGSGINFGWPRSSVVHGIKSHVGWHIDSTGSVRFLFNVAVPAKVNIATEWNPDHYLPGVQDDRYVPAAHRTMDIPSGGVYVFNNLLTDTSLQYPHQTTSDPDRLMLRTDFYAEGDWARRVENGGIVVKLALQEDAAQVGPAQPAA